jgi:hypothetical protein
MDSSRDRFLNSDPLGLVQSVELARAAHFRSSTVRAFAGARK